MGYFSGNITARGTMAKKMLVTSSNIINSSIDMNMKTITSVHDPVNAQDAATRYYVDASVQKVESEFQSFFSGVVVSLKGIEFTEVAHIKPGSYIVTVTPYRDGFPTATFSISKAGAYSSGHVMRMTAGFGNYTPETLELQWPEGGVLRLRKTGPGYDGDYLVDLNVKNMSTLSSPPVLPTDQASKAYVDKVVKEQLEIKFGGVTVNLEGTNSVNVMNLRPGSYVVAVTPMGIDGAPTATFSVSKNSVAREAFVIEITGCAGLYTPEQLEMTWPENSMLRLRKTGPGYDGMYLVDMNLKNFSSTATPATIPSDAVTVDYVEREIERKMQAKFGGQIVSLKNTDTTPVVNLRPGSYVISITPLIPNAPTATFAISKNSPYVQPSIIRTSSCMGIDSGEHLELLWPENSMILLRKTGPFYDGDYIVDFNLKNIQPNALIPTLPSDMASKQYVTHEINERLKIKFGGLEVHLVDTGFSEVAAIRPGSYIITIIPTVDGSATASFLISKSTMGSKASIVRMTSAPAADTGEVLELDWPENGKLLLRKTMPFHDGVYIVDMNLKNFTSVAPPIIPSDVASKEYVDNQIKNILDHRYLNKGIVISLSGSTMVPVIAMLPGSYMLSISPRVAGGPTATYSISKSSPDMEPSVLMITGTKGVDGNEDLYVTWPENDNIYVGKTGNNYDGIYVVDTNLRNMVSNTEITEKLLHPGSIQQYEFNLMGTNEIAVAFLLPGSYFAYLSSSKAGLYHATYSFTKTVADEEGKIITLSLNKTVDEEDGVENIEYFLTMRWDASNTLFISKTVDVHDGIYVLKVM